MMIFILGKGFLNVYIAPPTGNSWPNNHLTDWWSDIKKIRLKFKYQESAVSLKNVILDVCVCVMQDGFLDAGEVANWILPGEVDHADNEAKHLIHETDTDKVNKRGQKHQTVHKQSAWFQTDGKKKNFNNPLREDDLLQQQHHKKNRP